jgi:hypothetical protein
LYTGLSFDGNPAPSPFVQEAARHEFWFYYSGQGSALTIALRAPAWAVEEVDGELQITVESLSEAEQELVPEILAAKRAEEARHREAVRVREAEERLRKETEPAERERRRDSAAVGRRDQS